MKYFGRINHSVTCVADDHVATPVGKPCGWCDEIINAGDDGWLTPCAANECDDRMIPFHRVCYFRQIVGSVAHQKRECSCFGGNGEDDPKLTRLEAAYAAEAFWENERDWRPKWAVPPLSS